jgi:hypothetical protein
MNARGLLITLMMAIAMTGCMHQTRTIDPQPISNASQVSLTEPWTARGKLLVTTEDVKQSLRFTWSHNTASDDIITIGDTLGIRQLELHERNGVLFQRMADGTLQSIQTHQLEGELSGLALLSPSDLARALTGETSISHGVSSEVTAWQSVDGITAPRVIRVQGADIAVKVVINSWELTKNV